MIVIRDRETGIIFSWHESTEEAERCLLVYEEDDKRDGIYEPDYYEIADVDPRSLRVKWEE